MSKNGTALSGYPEDQILRKDPKRKDEIVMRKVSIASRLFALLLVVVMVVGLAPVINLAEVSAAQKDPVIVFRDQGLDMFEEMTNGIREGTVDFVLQSRVRKEAPMERKQTVKITAQSGSDDGTVKKEPKKADKKPGRNDPCPCGSGKKYKKCCMQKDKASGMEQ